MDVQFFTFIGFVGLWFLTFAISFFNAVSVGMAWTESSIIGGWQKIVNYSAMIMSMAGFTWCYLIIAMVIAGYFELLPLEYIEMMQSLGYLIIIFPVLGSGLAIMINSWGYALKNRSFSSLGIGTYNTLAQTYNMFRALDAVPSAIGNITEKLLNSRNSNNEGKRLLVVIVFLIVIVVAILGVLTTIVIIKWVARKDREKSIEKITKAY